MPRSGEKALEQPLYRIVKTGRVLTLKEERESWTKKTQTSPLSQIIAQLSGGWFKLPRGVFRLQLNKSDFAVYLYLLRCVNAQDHGWPSTKDISPGLRGLQAQGTAGRQAAGQ